VATIITRECRKVILGFWDLDMLERLKNATNTTTLKGYSEDQAGLLKFGYQPRAIAATIRPTANESTQHHNYYW
jgi:hypothetical protein